MQNGEFPLISAARGTLCEELKEYGMKEIAWD